MHLVLSPSSCKGLISEYLQQAIILNSQKPSRLSEISGKPVKALTRTHYILARLLRDLKTEATIGSLLSDHYLMVFHSIHSRSLPIKTLLPKRFLDFKMIALILHEIRNLEESGEIELIMLSNAFIALYQTW